MVPMRHSSIFRSRWFALAWAAGILWFAYDIAGTPSDTGPDGNANAAAPLTDATGMAVNAQQADDLKKALDSI